MGNQKSDVSQRLRDNGVCCECAERGANYFLHLLPVEPGVAPAHPSPIYTSSVTSPHFCLSFSLNLPILLADCINIMIDRAARFTAVIDHSR